MHLYDKFHLLLFKTNSIFLYIKFVEFKYINMYNDRLFNNILALKNEQLTFEFVFSTRIMIK